MNVLGATHKNEAVTVFQVVKSFEFCGTIFHGCFGASSQEIHRALKSHHRERSMLARVSVTG